MLELWKLADSVGFKWVRVDMVVRNPLTVEVWADIAKDDYAPEFSVCRHVDPVQIDEKLFQEIVCELREYLIECGYLQ